MKKYIVKIPILLGGIFILLLIASALIYSPEYMYRVIRYQDSDVGDYQIFPERTIQNSATPYYYETQVIHGLGDQLISYRYNHQRQEKKLIDLLEETQTTAMIIIQNDQIVFEQYLRGYSEDSIQTSFSSVKSVVSLLIGIAIDEGYIKSENQSIADYIEEFKGTSIEEITIKDLLTMRSKIRYEEGGAWFGDDTKTYYMPNLRELALTHIKIDQDYGGQFHYNNYHPLLLGIILERSTGQSVASFLEEKIWKKLGTEYSASFSLDSEDSGFEKMESGLNFRSIDFAKLGSMLLHKGQWNGERIVSEDWINQSTVAEFPIRHEDYENSFLENKAVGYQYLWYSLENPQGGYDIFAAGKYGQFLYISPVNHIVIVRNGIEDGKIDWWPEALMEIANRAAKINK